QKVLALPEQMFRVWAWWSLNLDFYHTPSNSKETWDLADEAWMRHAESSPLRRSEEGEEFTNILSFSYFCVARVIVLGGAIDAAPAKDFDELRRQQFVF